MTVARQGAGICRDIYLPYPKLLCKENQAFSAQCPRNTRKELKNSRTHGEKGAQGVGARAPERADSPGRDPAQKSTEYDNNSGEGILRGDKDEGQQTMKS